MISVGDIAVADQVRFGDKILSWFESNKLVISTGISCRGPDHSLVLVQKTDKYGRKIDIANVIVVCVIFDVSTYGKVDCVNKVVAIVNLTRRQCHLDDIVVRGQNQV